MRSRLLLSALALFAFGTNASADSDPNNLPSAVYLICFVSYDWEPPKYDDYAAVRFVSPITLDHAPKSMSTLEGDRGIPYTKTGAQVAGDMIDWLTKNFKEPSRRTLTGCRTFDTRLKAYEEREILLGPMGGYLLAGEN